MEGGKANRYAALQGGEGGSQFCQKMYYVTVERSHIMIFEGFKISKINKP